MIPHSRPQITFSDISSITRLLKRGMFSKGDAVSRFEGMIADYHGVQDAVCCSSGTSGLVLSLLALGIGRGHEVALPTYVCRSVAEAVLAVGGQPVFCDSGGFWNMTPAAVSGKVTRKTRAIVVAHVFGIGADARSFKRFGLPVIEDCCQAFGGIEDGSTLGTSGDIAVFSFHATKCLATGEGGAVISRRKDLIRKVREIQEENLCPSFMSDLQAAVGMSQLKRYASFLKKRKAIASAYFKGIPEKLCGHLWEMRDRSMFFRFPLFWEGARVPFMQREYASRGISVRRGVDRLLHREYGLSDSDFPTAVRCFNHTVSIPLYPALRAAEQDRIIRVTKEILE